VAGELKDKEKGILRWQKPPPPKYPRKMKTASETFYYYIGST
jgi:hypothetical protein